MERRDGALRRVGDQSLAGRIPEGLRDAVGKRLSRLSDSTNRALSVASVIGREFQLDVLRQVLACAEEQLEAALEEASAAGILEERSVVGTTITYRFNHAFFRQTLYDEVVAPRRIRLHQQVARALEEVHRRRLVEHAAELAEHYAFSSDALDLAKAVQYGELAARHATEVFAYAEAARQLERAVVVQDLLDSDDRRKRCELLLALGEVLLLAGEAERLIMEVAPGALALADSLDDRDRAFRACRLAFDAIESQATVTGTALPEYLGWAQRAHDYADPDSIQRIHADLALANAWITQYRWKEAHAIRLEAMTLARQFGDPETLFRSAFYLTYSGAPQHWTERLMLAEQCSGWPRQRVSSQALGLALWVAGSLQLANGERARAVRLWREVEDLAERTRVVILSLFVPHTEAILAIVDGRLEEAHLLLQRFVERAEVSGAALRGRLFSLQMLLAPALHLGQAATWLAAYEDYARLAGLAPRGPELTAGRALCLVELGNLEEARTILRPELVMLEADQDGEWYLSSYAALLPAALAILDREAVQVLVARLACVAYLSAGDWFYFCLARYLGDAAALLGDRTSARSYYVQALESAGKIGFRSELALTRVSLAELLLQERDETARFEALEHLDIAIPELRDMKMQPALERALALKGKFEPPAAQRPGRQSTSDTLTAREREIADLMADGLSNREMAEKLVISEGTVEVHVKHILGKLGFRSRAQVAGWVARRGPA
jgi:DNA-binding CsgD family transcriptional regulator